jgi:hypothetical protein
MSDVKSVIALLCKHIKLLYNVNVKSEHFRLSKFSNTEESCVSLHFYLFQLYENCLNRGCLVCSHPKSSILILVTQFQMTRCLYGCPFCLQVCLMWDILYKMCKEMYPGLHEGQISSTKHYIPLTKKFQLVKCICI